MGGITVREVMMTCCEIKQSTTDLISKCKKKSQEATVHWVWTPFYNGKELKYNNIPGISHNEVVEESEAKQIWW